MSEEESTDHRPVSGSASREELDDLRREIAAAHATIRRLLGVNEPFPTESVAASHPHTQAETRIYDILKTAPAVVFAQDVSLKYNWFFNPLDPHPSGAPDFVGKSDSELFSPANAEILNALKRRVIESGRGCRQEVRLVGEEGERIFELILEPLREPNGRSAGVSGMAMDVTDRRQADREIRLLAQTVASTRDSVALVAPDGRILFHNDSFQSLLRWEQSELIGYDIAHLGAAPPENPPWEQIAREAAQESWHGEWTALKKDGTAFPVDLWVSPLRSDDGDVTALVAVARDLTERKRAERVQTATYRIAAAVSTTENLHDLYRAIHEIVGELMPARNFYIAVLDEPTGMLSFPYFVDEFDETPSPRLAARGLTEYVIRTGEPLLAPPEVFEDMERKGLVESIGAPSVDWLGVPLISSGHTRGALVLQSYSGGVRFGEEHRNILRFVSTQIAMAIERKRSEEAIHESEARLLTIFESLPFELWVCDSQGRYLMQNPTSIAHWGNQIGKTPAETGIDPMILVRWEENNRRAFAGETVSGEAEFTKGGKTYHIYNIITPIKRDGGVHGILGMNMDITETKVLQQQLLQAQKLESIGTLAGGIAHDFNNILAIIIGHASLLADVAGDAARLNRSISAIQKAGKRGAALVRQILTFARKANAVFESVNANEIVTELGRMLEETFPRTIVISLELAVDLPPIEADRTQLHQTLLNLCVNARDAMSNGGTLTIATERLLLHEEGRNGWYVRLSVADSGTGMDEVTQRRIFEPFFTTKEPGKGTGLGLSVVYGIMESHRGFITVESAPGRGTTFYLHFPVPATYVAAEQKSLERKGAGARGTETLLIVEDEQMLSELLKSSLEALGYTVIVAFDGEQALSIYETLGEDIALVISDLGLPRMSGRDLFLKIRALRPAARVIIATGYLDPDAKAELLGLGAASFLQKPYLPDDVARSVREVLSSLGRS
ncbi:MAG TPA: PAS domain S-box protein [Bacteroidota bacterium]|nr:PAS domain S-box protein [Bacteroidota bacterium]